MSDTAPAPLDAREEAALRKMLASGALDYDMFSLFGFSAVVVVERMFATLDAARAQAYEAGEDDADASWVNRGSALAARAGSATLPDEAVERMRLAVAAVRAALLEAIREARS